MCDMRNPPRCIIELSTGKILPVEFCGSRTCEKSSIPMTDIGVYLIGCTGVGYQYYDGQSSHDCYPWSKNWDNSTGKYLPPFENKYLFIFDEDQNENITFGKNSNCCNHLNNWSVYYGSNINLGGVLHIG